MKVSDYRKAIRILQIFPFIISILFLLIYLLIIIGYDFSIQLCPICGISFLSIFTMALIAKRMHVSSWSLFFYYLLLVIVIVDISSLFIKYNDLLINTASINFMLLVSGGCSSFITYLYERFKDISS